MPKTLLTPEQKRERARRWQAEWRSKNPERSKELARASYAKHAEARRAEKKAEYSKKRDIILERGARWRAKNKAWKAAYARTRRAIDNEQRRIRNAANRPLYRAKHNARARAYYKANPEMHSGRTILRRAIKRRAAIGDPKIISRWRARWQRKPRVTCYWCHAAIRGENGHADHIVALSIGGAHSIENLCISCAQCNCRKHAKTLSAWNAEIAEPILL